MHKTLEEIYTRRDSVEKTQHLPGAELAQAKRQLRDWIDGQLKRAQKDAEAAELSAALNRALKGVGVAGQEDDQDLLGQLDDVRVEADDAGFLKVITGVGVPCQFDQSAYVYEYGEGEWRRIWEFEQDDFSDKRLPEDIFGLHLFQEREGDKLGPLYVMALSNEWGCGSTWHTVFYRVWRVEGTNRKLLIDGSDFAWLRTEVYAVGSIRRKWWDRDSPVDALIEFTKNSIDGGVHNREAVLHYQITGDEVRRVVPVALSPRDFVDEWLTHDWKESGEWSGSAALASWYKRLHTKDIGGDFDIALHCQTPDLWQEKLTTDFDKGKAHYFLVRWRPPYRFTMMGLSDKPYARCTEKDPDADAWRTLFNSQEWRQ